MIVSIILESGPLRSCLSEKPGLHVRLLAAIAVIGVAFFPGCLPRPPAGAGSISGEELAARLVGPDAPLVLDVRSVDEFRDGHIRGAMNIPYAELADRVAELSASKDREVVVYCRSGRRAAVAEKILLTAGFQAVLDLNGHLQGWTAADFPIESAEAVQ